MIRRILLALCLVFLALPALAVNPDEILADPALELRARSLSSQLRCMVCQNQSIDDSNAELARDLRLLVRERISDGDTDDQVITYVVSRYGEFVLLNPRFEAKTLILWGAPLFLLAIGIAGFAVYARGRAGKPTGKRLTAEESAALDRLLGK